MAPLIVEGPPAMPRLIAPAGATCGRITCDAPLLSIGHSVKSYCSAACRVLEQVATALVNVKSVPRAREHARDVEFITRIMPVGNVAPVVLSDQDFRSLMAIRDAYVGKRTSRGRRQGRNT
ncbi:hypothetical protein GCM10009603_16540 [Nocardiopsis exhalans]